MKSALGALLLGLTLLPSPIAARETTCLPGEYMGDGQQLAVDRAGTLHLARVDRVGGALLHTTIAPDGAVTDAVVVARLSRLIDDEVRDLGLVVSDAAVEICAYDAVQQRFDVHTRAAGRWTRARLDTGPRIGETCALAPLPGGLFAAWHGDGVLRAALRGAGGWRAVDVDAPVGADVGGQPSIAVGDGVVAIAHFDATRRALRVSVAATDGPIQGWSWQTTALDVGGWQPAALFDGGRLVVYHAGIPDNPDVSSDVVIYSTAGPAGGPLETAVEPGVDLGGALHAAARDGVAWVFARSRTRSALFGAYDGLHLFSGPTGGALARQVVAESGPAGQRHLYQFVQVAPDPFGLPVLAWFDDAAAAFGEPARAVSCYARAPDRDGDAVPDVIELELGTDPDDPDTDDDGRTDGQEILLDGSDPGELVCSAEDCDGVDDDCDGVIDEGLDDAPCATGAPGVCAAGRAVCVDGAARCVPLIDASPERCSGVDEDCDGAIDEGTTACGFGVCAASVDHCLDGVEVACVPGPPQGRDSACDGVDADCDGRVDEAFSPQIFECGEGRCRSQAISACIDGVLIVDCQPGEPAPDDVTCDGVDDDCDGIADEDAGPVPVRCGVGACARDGFAACGAVGPPEDCAPGDPAPDDGTCDGIDDDCDGALDEDHVARPTACGDGACAAAGALRCANGVEVDTCVPGGGAPDDDCDGRDDDCDGAADEGFAAESTCGIGACRVRAPLACVGGVPLDVCTPGDPIGADDTCDGIDDDCDGSLDEAAPSAPIQCGQGACLAVGSRRCLDGAPVDDCAPGPATVDDDCDGVDDDCDGALDEAAVCLCPPDQPACGCRLGDASCDGLDDDCDGSTDEDYVPGPTPCGVGACATVGDGRCVGGVLEVDCAPRPPTGDDTDCDGVDDDCDGATDEGFVDGEITCGLGVCAEVGTIRCVDGRVIERCRPGAGRADDPTCNGLDDDCDGRTDEGAFPEPITCGVGACAADGQRACRQGSYVDLCAPGAPAADDATCDGVDDDCDGIGDEDAMPAESLCGVGACAARGISRCVGGVPQDDCVAGAPAPDDAACDGIDDDCDGMADEGFAPRIERCGVGACAAEAAVLCIDGVEAGRCAPGPAAATDDACDGVDDDCDGAVDEDFVAAPVRCGRGACLRAVEQRCAAGVLIEDCEPGEPGPLDGVCDGVDADCDGTADEDFVGARTVCGVGACARSVRDLCVDGVFVEVACAPGDPGVERCDGRDGDCDGRVDEGCAIDADTGPGDADVDGETDAGGDDASDAIADGMTDAVADGIADGMADGMTDGAADGMPDTTPDGIIDGAPDGMLDVGPAPDGDLDAMPDAMPRPGDGPLDDWDATRLDYDLPPLQNLVAPRGCDCQGRIPPDGSATWPLALLLALLGLRRRR